MSKFTKNHQNLNINQMWKALESLCPKFQEEAPIAKYDHFGTLITDSDELKKLLCLEFKQRFRTRPVRPDMIGLKCRKDNIFNLLYNIAKQEKSEDFTLSDLRKAMSDLKTKKSRDPQGYINELFMKDVIGKDLEQSLLILFNYMKKENVCPDFMRLSNITAVPKSGSKFQLSNLRGINRISVFRGLYMRMIYNIKYDIIDKNMTEYQSGGRKNRGCRNNLFIVNGIIHEASKIKKQSKPVLIQLYDYSQMFDSLNLEQAMVDVYEVGLQGKEFTAVYQVNRKTNIAVKTQDGTGERQEVESTVLQGDNVASIVASVQTDTIMSGSSEEGYTYQYKSQLSIGHVIQVDDIIGFTEPGVMAQMFNSYINIKTAEKQLQFNPKKCKVMYVGCDSESDQTGDLTVDSWRVEQGSLVL